MKKLLLLILLFTIFISFFRLGSTRLFDVDEAVFAQATKEMVQSGNWITPTYNGVVRYDKPILIYWLMALSYKAFGFNEFAARVPSAVAGVLLAAVLMLFMKRFRGEREAAYSGMALVLSVYFLMYSHAAVTDMVLTLFISLSLLSWYASLENRRGGAVPWYMLGFYFFSALAFLTKGLIGIVFPFGIAAVFILLREGPRGLRKIFSWKGILLFTIIAGPWYAAEYRANGSEFIQQFFLKHHFKRFLDANSGHSGPFFYYIPVLLLGLFPWIAFLPSGIRNALREKSTGLFALIWFSFIFIFFSLSSTKLPNYILPAVPAAVILIAAGMSREGWRKHADVFTAVLSAGMGAALIFSSRLLLKQGIIDTGWTIWAAAALFGISAVCLYSLRGSRTFYLARAALVLFFLSMLTWKALPIAGEQLQGALYRYSVYARDLPAKDRVIAYRLNKPSIVFYSDHKVVTPGTPEEVAAMLHDGRRHVAISGKKDIDSLKGLGFVLVESGGGYALLERK